MSTSVGYAAGEWWHFDKYEIVDGFICPAKDAKLHKYSPWDRYQDAKANQEKQPASKETAARNSILSPYKSLISMLNTLTTELPQGFDYFEQKQRITIGKESQSQLLDWCSQHGLLGILPQEALQIDMCATSEGEPNRFIWTNSGWIGGFHDNREEHPAGALIRRIAKSEIEFVSFINYWGQFFPSIPEQQLSSYEYPIPLSKEFWRIYSEPVDLFLAAAQALKITIEALTKIDPIDIDDSNKALFNEDNPHLYYYNQKQKLQQLAGSAYPALNLRNNNSWIFEWITPSLLSSYAVMAMQDFNVHVLRRCEVCGLLFNSSDSRSKYCSKSCQSTATKRAQRQREKEGK